MAIVPNSPGLNAPVIPFAPCRMAASFLPLKGQYKHHLLFEALLDLQSHQQDMEAKARLNFWRELEIMSVHSDPRVWAIKTYNRAEKKN